MASVGIEDAPMEMVLSQCVYPQRQSMIGKRFRVAHLKSARGQELNGQIVTAVGFDRTTEELRLHCRFDDGETIKLKSSNLSNAVETYDQLREFMSHSRPIPNNTLAACLSIAIQKHNFNTDRADLSHRLQLYRTLLERIENNPDDLSDQDFCFPCGAGSELLRGNFALVMQKTKPACYGNEMLDMRHIDIGLKGDNETECSVCHEVLSAELDTILVTLPCLHIFHEACIVDWLGSDLGQHNWSCPSCRAVVPSDMSTYRNEYEEQLQRRVDEYPVSGFCAKCMIMIMENNRNEPLPIV